MQLGIHMGWDFTTKSLGGWDEDTLKTTSRKQRRETPANRSQLRMDVTLGNIWVILACLGTALSKPIEAEIEPWHLKAHLLISSYVQSWSGSLSHLQKERWWISIVVFSWSLGKEKNKKKTTIHRFKGFTVTEETSLFLIEGSGGSVFYGLL